VQLLILSTSSGICLIETWVFNFIFLVQLAYYWLQGWSIVCIMSENETSSSFYSRLPKLPDLPDFSNINTYDWTLNTWEGVLKTFLVVSNVSSGNTLTYVQYYRLFARFFYGFCFNIRSGFICSEDVHSGLSITSNLFGARKDGVMCHQVLN
jgi:hypothetical protein